MGPRRVVPFPLLVLLLALAGPSEAQELPLSPVAASGLSVTPVYEGWYENPDGSYTLSFGYYNRNAEETLDVPLGDGNRIEPAVYDGVQPTHFRARRHWGVFAVRVPADFGEREVVWTLTSRGETVAVPGHLDPDWKIDALAGEAGSGNTPPVVRFGAARGQGPLGVRGEPVTARAGEPVPLRVHASDDGRRDTSIGSGGRPDEPVRLTWLAHSGPGEVTFDEASAEVEVAGGEVVTRAVFDQPGEYLVRVRANDASGVSGAGHAQCCWTNGFVPVTVSAAAEGPDAPDAPTPTETAANLAATTTGPSITYARDVAPIIQDNCVVCHQPNSIAPMQLTSYNAVLRYADRIRDKVSARHMPPWHIDRTVGIQKFKNDRGLNDEEYRTLLAWIDSDRAFGDEGDLPPPKEFPDPNEWQYADDFGEPDLVVKSEPYTLEAVTQDKWFRPVVETGLTEPRWVKAIEIKPSYPDGRRIVHHVLTYLEQQEEGGLAQLASTAGRRGAGLFMEWAVGKEGEIFADDAGKLMLPGSRIRWEVHMHAVGERIVDNQVELGIWFHPRGYVPENRTILTMFDARGPRGDLDIRPHTVSVTQGFHVLRGPARFENFQAHMHMRGRAMQMEAILPDGDREILSRVSDFQWNWHNNYIYADDAAPLLPEGTVIVITAWHDNTADNPSNPDPRQWVGWGDRTIDDMAHAWVDVTYLEQEDFERLVAEREARRAAADEGGGG